MSDDQPATPREVLDEKARHLARRHQRRLESITNEALAPTRRRPAPLLPVAAVATLVVAVSGYLLMPNDAASPEMAAATPAPLPGWVVDDEVPLELLEQPDFYRWLAEQLPQEEQEEEERHG